MKPNPQLIARDETLVPFSDAETLPGSPSRDSLIKWTTKGTLNHSGQLVYLEWVRDVKYARQYTSEEAYKRFRIAINK